MGKVVKTCAYIVKYTTKIISHPRNFAKKAGNMSLTKKYPHSEFFLFRIFRRTKVQSSKIKMESELLNAVNYIKNISKKKVKFAKIEAFMRKKELFTCKEDLDNIIDSFIENGLIQVRGDGENTAFQIADEVNSSQIPPSPESIDGKENTERLYYNRNIQV